MTAIGINPTEAGRKRVDSRWLELAGEINFFAEACEESWAPKVLEAAEHLRKAALLMEQHSRDRQTRAQSAVDLFGSLATPRREKPDGFMGGKTRKDASPPTTDTSADADVEPGR